MAANASTNRLPLLNWAGRKCSMLALQMPLELRVDLTVAMLIIRQRASRSKGRAPRSPPSFLTISNLFLFLLLLEDFVVPDLLAPAITHAVFQAFRHLVERHNQVSVYRPFFE